MNFELFFMKEVPEMLKNLQADSQAQWGSMTASEMLDHLRRGIELSLRSDIPIEILTPAEKLDSFQNFLKGDRLFIKGSPEPKEFALIDSYEGDFEALKMNLMKSLVKMQVHFENNPEHLASHPNFGELGPELWLHLHRKHVLHHFTQFGITNNS